MLHGRGRAYFPVYSQYLHGGTEPNPYHIDTLQPRDHDVTALHGLANFMNVQIHGHTESEEDDHVCDARGISHRLCFRACTLLSHVLYGRGHDPIFNTFKCILTYTFNVGILP